MDNKLDISIIIVNWNVRDLLEKCLTSIFKQTQGISFEVFVIDNDSTDKSVEMVKEKFPQVKLIANRENRGFAAANNQGIKKARGEFVLLLNPDTEILDNALAKMVNFMRENKNVGVAGCKLLNSDKTLQPSVRRFPTLFSQVLILFKIHHFLPNLKTFRQYFAKDFDYSKTQEADQVMGAFFMIREEIFDQIGYLDENYFIWFEEVDFCKRVKNAGWKVIYTPGAKVVHHCSQSFKQVLSLKKQRIFNKSLSYYFKKHYSFSAYLVIQMCRPQSLVLAWIFQAFSKMF